VILFRLGTPEELRAPLGVIGAACGPLAFGIYYILRSKNKKIASKHTFAIRATVWGLVAVIAFSAYWIIINRCVVKESGNSEVFFPLFLIGKEAQEVAKAGGYRSFYQLVGPGDVARLLEGQSLPIVASYVILISLFCLGSVATPVSIGLLCGKKCGQNVLVKVRTPYGQRLDASAKTTKTEPPQPLATPPQIFVSYASGDTSPSASEEDRQRQEVVECLCDAVKDEGWEVVRDKQALQYGD
jgi:hypothetical protein